MTAAEAMKQLKQLQLKRKQILDEENETSKFIAAVTEDIDAVRPEYNFQFTKLDLDVVENNIRDLKHRLNVFNSTYMIPELGLTIDQVLVMMPMVFVLALYTDVGPVVMYCGVKLVDVVKLVVFHFWLKKERWLKNLTNREEIQ